MKKWNSYIGWLMLFAILIVSLGFSTKKQGAKVCEQILIKIDYSSGNYFVVEEDISSMVYHEIDTVLGRPIAAIESERLEHKISNHPSIEKAEVFKRINGDLVIEVTQRQPIVRLFNYKGESFYLDMKGNAMPISDQFTSRVLIANGYIFGSFIDANQMNDAEKPSSVRANQILKDIFAFAEYIYKDEFWSAQIEQLYVNKEFDIELIPRVGNHRIVFGDASLIEEKFNKLKIFYFEGLSKTGWNEYSVINLKYANQVVCKKRN